MTHGPDRMSKSSYSVLIADDLEADRFFFKRAMARNAPRLRVVGEAGNGDQLIEYLSGQNQYADRKRHPFPDLLVMDLLMARKDGLPILLWLKTQDFGDRLKVALLADPALCVSMVEALKLGAVGIYYKTVHYEGLNEVARSLESDWLIQNP